MNPKRLPGKTSMRPIPYISIILLSGIQRGLAEKSLAKILEQNGIENAEVLIFDLEFDEYPPLAGSDHPVVKIHPVKESLSLGALRAKAVEIARGEVIAFVEDHANVMPGWLETLIRDFQAGYGGVGGVPEPLNPGIGISDAAALMNFSFFYPATEPRTDSILPGHNSAYRRDLLLSFGKLLPTLLTSEALLDSKIVEKGYTLLLDPQVRFLHINEETLSAITASYYYWNQCFGESRAKIYEWSWQRRMAQGLMTPLVPFVRYGKYMLHFWRHDRKNILTLLRYTGLFLYAQSLAAIGLAVGCIFGARDAEIKFRDYELNTSRKKQPAR